MERIEKISRKIELKKLNNMDVTGDMYDLLELLFEKYNTNIAIINLKVYFSDIPDEPMEQCIYWGPCYIQSIRKIALAIMQDVHIESLYVCFYRAYKLYELLSEYLSQAISDVCDFGKEYIFEDISEQEIQYIMSLDFSSPMSPEWKDNLLFAVNWFLEKPFVHLKECFVEQNDEKITTINAYILGLSTLLDSAYFHLWDATHLFDTTE